MSKMQEELYRATVDRTIASILGLEQKVCNDQLHWIGLMMNVIDVDW